MPLLGEHDMDDDLLPGPHQRQHRHTAAGPAQLRQLPLERGRLRPSTSASSPSDRWLCCVPLSHIAGLGIVMRSVIYGTAAVVHDGFDVDRVGEALERDGITLVSLVATMLTRLLEAGVDLSGPRAILVGGGPVPAGAAGRGDRQGRHRGPDLRPDRDLLAGDDARARPTRSASSAPPGGRC